MNIADDTPVQEFLDKGKIIENLEKERLDSRQKALMLARKGVCEGAASAGELLQILYQDPSGLRDSMNSRWQNIGLAAALIGSIGLSVLVNSISSSTSGLQESQFVLSDVVTVRMMRAYYIFWALTAFSELGAVMIVIVFLQHFAAFVVNDEDIVWFVNTYTGATFLPETLVTIGCLSALTGSCLGVFIICDIPAGIAVSVIGGTAAFLFFIPYWVSMIIANKKKLNLVIKQFQEKQMNTKESLG